MMNDDAECVLTNYKNTKYRVQNTDYRIQKYKSKESPYKLMNDDAVSALTEEAAASRALFQMLGGLIFDQIDPFQHSVESAGVPTLVAKSS